MRSKRPSSIRWSLLRSFVTIVLLSSLTVLVFMSIRARETEQQLSENIIRSGTRQAVRELDAFVHPAREAAQVGSSWGRDNLFPLKGAVDGDAGTASAEQLAWAQRFGGLLLPVLQSQEELSSGQVASERGEGLMVLQDGEGAWVRVVNRPRWGTQTLWLQLDRDGNLLGHEWREVDYDPASRPWFLALEGQPDRTIYWTEPYTFFTTGDLGLTASSGWSLDGVRYAVAWDVLLTDLTEFTHGVSSDLTERATIVVTTADQKVIAIPRHSAYVSKADIHAAYMQQLSELEAPQARALAAAMQGLALPASLKFDSEGDTWWAGVRAYELAPGQDLLLAVMVPDGDLLKEVAQQRVILLGATALALLAALAYSLLLARGYSRPLEALAAQSEKIRRLDFEEDEQIEARLVEFQMLADSQRQSLRALQSFSKYVPVDVVSELMKTNQVARIGGRMQSLTVMFSDIAGFTSIAETLSPEELAQLLSRYFGCVVHDLQHHGATVDKLIGDAVMAFWGAPRPMPDHCRRAALAADAARHAVAALNRELATEGRPQFPTRFGLATGPVVVGNMGAPDRLAYTVIGDTVNLASRLEGLNKRYGSTVMAEQAVVNASGDGLPWRRLDRVRVAGRSEPVWVYELMRKDNPGLADAYRTAWDLYAEADFEQAARLLEALLEAFEDAPAKALLRRCRALAAEPPGPEWDGITNLVSK